MKNEALVVLEKIQQELNNYLTLHPQHGNSVLFLTEKFSQIGDNLKINGVLSPADIEWLQFSAPRIIYEGIRSKSIISELDNLNSIIQKNL